MDGVIVCAGLDLVDVLRGLDDEVEADEVATTFELLVDYVRKRDLGEDQAAGRPARTVEQYTIDFVLAITAAMGVVVTISAASRLPGSGWASLIASVALTFAFAGALRKAPFWPRTRALLVGCLAASAGMLAAFLIAISLSLIW